MGNPYAQPIPKSFIFGVNVNFEIVLGEKPHRTKKTKPLRTEKTKFFRTE